MKEFKLDPVLREYATDLQWKKLSAWEACGSHSKAAKKLGCAKSAIAEAWKAVKNRAAKRGYSPDHDYTHTVPDGFRARGVSTYYGKDGEVRGQWVKSEVDRERVEALREAMIQAMKDEIAPVAATPFAKIVNKPDLCVVYPVGDHHLGMLSWDKETGADWDLKLAEASLNKATDYLIDAAPDAGTGLFVFLGDYLHYDSFETVTPQSKNQLDADSRFPKMVRTGIRTMRYSIDAALAKHERVHVIIEIGNHDTSSSIWLMEMMNFLYENEPRITIDTSPMHSHYFRFGKNLIGVTHGDKVKMPALPLMMATDRPEDWAKTLYRLWLTGHIHHGKTQAAISAQDYSGVTVESMRILAAADAWAAENGYRAARDMKSIVLHREFGEVSRNTVNPRMFK